MGAFDTHVSERVERCELVPLARWSVDPAQELFRRQDRWDGDARFEALV